MEGKVPYVKKHIAVTLDHYIVVMGGIDSETGQVNAHSVWLYNLFLEQWQKYEIPKKKQAPDNLIRACGVVIGKDIITFGGETRTQETKSNELWKLTRNTNDSFEWNRILSEKQNEDTFS